MTTNEVEAAFRSQWPVCLDGGIPGRITSISRDGSVCFVSREILIGTTLPLSEFDRLGRADR